MAERPRTREEQALECLLKAWGREYGGDYRDEPRRWQRTDSHPIAQAMQFGSGKKVRHNSRKIVGRGGYERRCIMGAAAGRLTKDGAVIPVPVYVVDPIPCKTRHGTGRMGNGQAVPPQLQKVERAVQLLEEFAMIRALCLRVQYAGEGEHRDKVAKVNEKLRQISKGHEGIAIARYRDELTYARVWLHGALIDLLKSAA